MYEWTRPRAAVPAHGEAQMLSRHVAFAKELGVEQVVSARNGDIVRLAPGAPAVVGKLPSGRVFKDGEVLVSDSENAVRERAKLAFAGVVSIALAVDRHGEMMGDPDVVFAGLPKRGKNGEDMGAVVDGAVFETFDGLSRQRRRDFDSLSTAIERAVRGAVFNAWGKKPLVHVLVVGG